MKVNELPNTYDKYDSATQVSLGDLLESIQHLVHIVNGIADEIMSGKYEGDQARLDYENLIYNDGIDVFTALEEVADAPWEIIKKSE